MMGKTFQGKTKTKVVTFNGFSVTEEGNGKLFAPVSQGCDCHGGVLRRGVGVEPCLNDAGDEILVATYGDVAAAFYTQFGESTSTGKEKLFVVDTDGLLYNIDVDTGRSLYRYDLGNPIEHCAVRTEKRKNIHLLWNKQRVAITVNYTQFTVSMMEPLYGCCVLGGRSFVGQKARTIKYSLPYALNVFEGDSSDCGMIYLPDGEGEIRSLRTDGKYVYVFMKREIYRLTIGADVMDFAIENVAYFGGDICVDSTLVTPNGIVFLTMTGAYRLRGKKAEPICKHLPIRPMDAQQSCSVGYCEDMALIDYKTRDANGEEITQRVALSVEDDDGYFCERRGTLGGNDLCVLAGVLHRFVKDSPGALYRTAPCFKTGKLDFGAPARKIVKFLRLEGKGTVRVYIQGEGETHSYIFHLDGGVVEKKALISGKTFNVRMYPDAQTEVRSMQVGYNYTEG